MDNQDTQALETPSALLDGDIPASQPKPAFMLSLAPTDGPADLHDLPGSKPSKVGSSFAGTNLLKA